uniref:Similarity. Hypothetical start n=1 Tax=Microcystis aeruginosa (strain PCC 7806) TaxID=267872 RepID=A8YJW8_MICA7|nr:unnamed protein product [Microcystis aeruginosa PCC 7806]
MRGFSKALPLLRVISMIDRRAQALRPYSNGFCPQCRGELRSPKRYIIKAQVPKNPRLLQAGRCQLINTWDSINRFSQSKRH